MTFLLHTRIRLDELKSEFIAKMFLLTSNVEATYREIKAKGAVPNGEIEPYPPDHRYFSVNDSDGNYLFIVQSLRGSLNFSALH